MERKNNAEGFLLPIAVVGGAMLVAMFRNWDKLALVLFGVLVLLILGMTVSAISDGAGKNKQKKQTINEKQRKMLVAEMTALANDYIPNPHPGMMVTRAAWEKYQDFLQVYGIQTKYKIPHVFEEVRCFLNREITWNIEAETAKAMRERNIAFAEILWDFYYQVAFSYDLEENQQASLLYYLIFCFRGGEDDYNYLNRPGFLCDAAAWEQWNTKCLTLLEEGMRKENAYATQLMACCYYEKEIVTFRDYDKAFELYLQAAKLGDVHSAYMLGQCYENGRGVRRDFQKAGDCYKYAYDHSGKQSYADALDQLYVNRKWDKNRCSSDIFAANNPAADSGSLTKEDLEKLKGQLISCAKMDLESEELDLAAVRVRKILEEVVNAFTARYASDDMQESLADKLVILLDRGYFTKEISDKAHFVRKVGNKGAHGGNEPLTPDAVRKAIVYLRQILEYCARY